MTGPARRPSKARGSNDASSPRDREDDLALAERPLEFSAQARYYAPFREQVDTEPPGAPEPASPSGAGPGRSVAQANGAKAAGTSGTAGRKAGRASAANPRASGRMPLDRPTAASGASTAAARASGSGPGTAPERPRERLSPGARALANRLAGQVSLVNTVRGFPHVLNRLARDWQEPLRFYDTMNDLLMDRRGNRAGFPFAVANELTLLLEHYRALVHPPRVDERWKGIDPR